MNTQTQNKIAAQTLVMNELDSYGLQFTRSTPSMMEYSKNNGGGVITLYVDSDIDITDVTEYQFSSIAHSVYGYSIYTF